MDLTGNAQSLPGPVLVVTGPTATGKSDLAVALATELGGEIVNADSMQLYRGMDIGTAKLPITERHGVPHHLLDIWDVTHTADVASYRRLARDRIDALLASGRTPVLVGGSGLYIQAVVDHLDFPGTDPRLRAELETELARVGPAVLHRRLTALDPEAGAAILPSNGRRIVRALEVVSLNGSFTATLPRREAVYHTVQLGLDRDTEELDDRLARRVDLMWEQGFVAEVERLRGVGLEQGRTAGRALGYRQILAHLNGEWDEDTARQRTVSGTRRFVRRQRSWFRRDDRITWLDAGDRGLVGRALAVIRDRSVAARG